MAKLATDYAVLTRISEFARRLHQLHRLGDDEAIDREFSAVCRAIWGFTLDDFTDDDLSPEDHAWLDELTQERACDFAAEQGYDLKDYIRGGLLAYWSGFTWMNRSGFRHSVFSGSSLAPGGRGAARGQQLQWWPRGFFRMPVPSFLAQARGVLTPEKRAAAWCRHGEKTWWARRRDRAQRSRRPLCPSGKHAAGTTSRAPTR